MPAQRIFLIPTLRAQFPDPSSFAGMDDAALVLLDALEADAKIVIFADYDVDGATSAAQLVRWFRHMGKEIGIYIPDRLTEGVGRALPRSSDWPRKGAELVVDYGLRGGRPRRAECGGGYGSASRVVIDHHMMPGAPPPSRGSGQSERAELQLWPRQSIGGRSDLRSACRSDT